ncbi:MAG TPA: hypothetical protein VEF89_21610 [Solirubrobacteraceae bacterium]|nr:hypothetical protein [Solirubrobacteraceae bacterium]
MLIGVPVAFTPAFGPHEEVLVELAAALAVVLELDALDAALEALEVVLLLLLPHAASSNAPTSTASATHVRRRSAWWFILTLVLLL